MFFARVRLILGYILLFCLFTIDVFTAMIPAELLRLFGAKKASFRWVDMWIRWTSRVTLAFIGVKLHIEGKENLSEDEPRLCFVANHESMLDIPAIFVAAGRRLPGTITKIEIKKVPYIRWWCSKMDCVYIDRKNMRSAVKAIMDGVEHIKEGRAMLIFPEGTRSKTGEIGEFKAGAFELATRADAVIVPIQIKGTRGGLEARRRWHVDAWVTIGKPIPTAGLSREEKRKVHTQVEESIRAMRREVDAKGHA